MKRSKAHPTDADAAQPATEVARQQLAPEIAHQRSATARLRVAATAGDLGRLSVGVIGAFLAAMAYLFWRTAWGAVDATAFDTAIAAAVLLTPAPTWLAWMLAGAIEDRATPGQQRRAIVVRFARSEWTGARLLRFAIHPLSAPGWLWLATITYLLDAPLLTWLFMLFAAVVALTGLGSIVLLAAGRRTFHDLLLRTEVEAAA